MGLCPFHKEKTPSFTVNDEKAFYHCFGCGQHGDIIGFIKEYENISYKEAIEKLAEEGGIALPKMTHEAVEQERRTQVTRSVVEEACRWFEHQLENSAFAQDYIKSRGLAPETVSRFRMGFAPDGRENLKQAMLKQGFSEKQLVEAGLLIQVEGKPTYDRFRRRLMFAIRDRNSKVIAFGGRVLPNDPNPDAPKYLNSPETELFHKGHQLFNFDLARRPAMETGQLIVCEGYMDVIALYQAGITNAVAPLGTAITESQLQMAWQVCEAPVLCLDGDAAGARAMQRATELALPLLQPGKTLRIARLPQGEDPDSLVRTRGAEAMLAALRDAPTIADVLWSQVGGQGANSPEQRAGQEAQLLALAEKIQNTTVRSHVRQFFREKLWPKFAGKGGVNKGAAKGLPPLPNPQDFSARQLRAVREMVRAVMLCPNLLADGATEDMLMQCEIADSGITRLRDALLDFVHSEAEPTTSGLMAWLAARGMQEQAAGVLKVGLAAPKASDDHFVPQEDMDAARRQWQQAVNAYHAAHIAREYQEATDMLKTNAADELALERVHALKSQLRAMETERTYLLNAADAG